MKLYENVLICRQDMSQQQMDALGVSLCMFITQNGGEVIRGEYCGFRKLAYQIKKNHKGHYYIIQMKANSSIIAELERIMRINEDIIRHLVVAVEAFTEKEVIISQAKTYNEDFAKDDGYRNTSNKTIVADDVAVVGG